MIKIFNKYFALIMIFMILLTTVNYYSYQKRLRAFITNSKDHIIILENNEELDKDKIEIKLRNLTHQDVKIEEVNDEIRINIKCPPEKKNFFVKWILDKKWED